MKRGFLSFLFLAFASASYAGPADAVVRLDSHGGSGTAIATGPGWTLILSCAHCFDGSDRRKPLKIDMPHPAPSGPKKVGFKILAVGETEGIDLALIKLNAGPVPYVTPVAPLGWSGCECLSIGYDEMEIPPQCRPAKITQMHDDRFFTDARPWHGRSGGALLDRKSGYLVGVVSAYTMTEREKRAGKRPRSAEYVPGTNGVYVSLPAIHTFLVQAGVMEGHRGSRPDEDPFSAPFRRAPGGSCPPGRNH